MKKYLCAFMLLVSCIQVSAQGDFIQPGAEWYYSFQQGSFLQFIHSEVVYNGTVCKRVKHETSIDTFYYNWGFRVNDLPDMYVYTNADTVFIYNHLFGKFTPLYVFNVNQGDTLCLPLLPLQTGTFTNPVGDTTFCFVIDSVKMELYDTAYLKTVYTTPLSDANRNDMDYGKYIWRIGTPAGLLPKCVNHCAFVASDHSQGDGDIRCYHDHTISVKYVTGDCNRGVRLDVADVNEATAINIYPNPASGLVSITNPTGHKITRLIIAGVDGRLYKSYTGAVPLHMDTGNLPGGIYLINIVLDDGRRLIRRLQVVK